MPPPRSSTNGIKKPSKGKARESGLEQIELALNGGKLQPAKASMAVEQAVLSDASGQHEQHDDAGREGRSSPHTSEQSSSTAHEAPAATTIKGGDESDTDMSEVESHSGATGETSSMGVSRDGVGTASYSQRDDIPQVHDGAASENGESLGHLDPPPVPSSGQPSNSTPVHDDLIDGWGTFRGSTFVIIRSGPRQSAMYRFEYRPKYENEEMRNISDEEFRISSLRDKDSSGKKHWRYSRDNVQDIYGVTSEVRNPYKEYKNPPCVWLKIKWKGLTNADQEKVVRGCSWIPRSEFTRFCGGKRATMVKIHEFWDKQENRYQKFLENADGMAYEDRSPTPCPLGLSSNSSQTRRSASRSRTPENEPDHSTRNQTQEPSRRRGSGAREVNRSSSNGPGSSNLSSPVRTAASVKGSHAQRVTNESSAEPRQVRYVLSQDEFFAEMKEEWNWEELSEGDRMRKKVEARALYDVYRETADQARMESQPEQTRLATAPPTTVN